MAIKVQEPGYNGQLISLGGVKGAWGRGRNAVQTVRALTGGVGMIGLPSNPMRIAATVQIFNGTDDLQVFFGDSTDGAVFLLAPRDLLQINMYLPWVGAVYLYSTGSMSVLCNEVEVQT